MAVLARLAKRRLLALAAGGVGSLTLAVYLTLIAAQSNDSAGEVAPWAISMAVASGAAFASASSTNVRTARVLMAIALVMFSLLGVIALFSVGIGFIVAAVLAALAIAEPSRAAPQRS